ncbi:hypothetical protein [Phascolarctobacterium succinatutens]|uniref:hypothetical protein n=1 Tax=Phascolarctobacterium succinatutens TaxID=626940 RepID=UPI0026EFFE9C|nr:hypothetical protein [Phascolarctobacterium succinatutens]
MKKTLFAMAAALMILNAGFADAADRIVPETNKISPQMHLEIVGTGENQQPVWVADNSKLLSKQTVATGTYETRVNDKTGALEVIKNGNVISSYKAFDISEHFEY